MNATGLPISTPSAVPAQSSVEAAAPVVLSIGANAPLNKSTGQVTVNGTATCSVATLLTVDVTVVQQTKGKTKTTVTGAGSATMSCNGATPWSAIVTATDPTGSKLAAGVATATASASGASVTRTVQVK